MLRLCSVLLAAVSQPAFAAGTLAGIEIDNIATASFDGPSGTVEIQSNRVIVKVDEKLDVVVTGPASDISTAAGASDIVVPFTILNSGNGPESFGLVADVALGGDDFDPQFVRIAFDTDNSGSFDPGVDLTYAAGTNDPLLAPDGVTRAFVIVNVPAGSSSGQTASVALRATAATGSGTPGTSFAGLGEGGGFAVIGSSTASQQASGLLRVAGATASLVKSRVVTDIFGGERAVPGSEIRYLLTASVTGSGALTGLSVRDPIPAGTQYKPSSLTLDGAPLSDVADTDSGIAGASGIAVALGTVTAGTSHNIAFSVVIQ